MHGGQFVSRGHSVLKRLNLRQSISASGQLAPDRRELRSSLTSSEPLAGARASEWSHDRQGVLAPIYVSVLNECIVNLQAEIDRLDGVPYGWMKIYETLLFGFYNPRTGQCFPSHKAIAIKDRCGVRTVQRSEMGKGKQSHSVVPRLGAVWLARLAYQ